MYNDDYEMDFTTLKSVKTEIIDYEEVASPSLSELNVATADDNFNEQDFHNASLKDLRALSSCSSTMQCERTRYEPYAG